MDGYFTWLPSQRSESDTDELRRASGSWEEDDAVHGRRELPLASAAKRLPAAIWDANTTDVDANGVETPEVEDDGSSGGGEVFQMSPVATELVDDERKQLLFERNRLRHHQKQLEELLDTSEDSNKQLSDTVKSLEAELAGLRRTNRQLRRRLEEETARADEMDRRVGVAEKQGDSLRLEVGRLKERNARLKGELVQSQGNIAEFLRDVAEKKACIQQLEVDLAGFRRSCSRLTHQEAAKPMTAAAPDSLGSASPSIREEILSKVNAEDSQLLKSGPSPFCEKTSQVGAETPAQSTNGEFSEKLDVAALLEERNRYKQQLQEAMARIQSTSTIIQHDLLNKFNALEQQVRQERRENFRLSEQLKSYSSNRRSMTSSDCACQVGEPFMSPELSRYEVKFPRSFLHHHTSPKYRSLSTGRICKSFKPLTEGRPRQGSSVDALDLAIKSSLAASQAETAIAASSVGGDQRNQEIATAAITEAASVESLEQTFDIDMASGAGVYNHNYAPLNHFKRRKRRVSFGTPLNQVSQQEQEKYLMDLVHRPVQDDENLTEEDVRVSSMLLQQAAEASRRHDDSVSSPDGSPSHLKRQSRTSSSFMSSMKESDYSTWSQSEPLGASLSVSVDDFSQSQSQYEPDTPVASVQLLSSPHRSASDDGKESVPFPSLPDDLLRELKLLPGSLTELDCRNGSVSLIDLSRRFRLDDVPDAELEDRVRSLAISFSNDAITLSGRVKRLCLARVNLERNIASELAALEAGLANFKIGGDNGHSHAVLLPTPAGLQVLRDSVNKLNRTAEILGAVKQEIRLNYAFHLMMKYMELLREEKEKQSHELEQLRQAMEEGKFFMPDEEIVSKRSKSVIGSGASQKEGQRQKFQDLGRNVARTSSITSLRRKMSRERKSTDDPDSDKSGNKDKKWKIEEEIYQSGFERGMRMSASQQLSQLKTEQATFSEQLEKMLDRQHLTDGEETDLDRLSSDWLSDKRIRLLLAPFTLLVTLVFLLWAVAYPIVKQLVGRW